jgi:hypothetical protein
MVRWKEGILNLISRGMTYHFTDSLGFMLSMRTRWSVELVTSKKCKKGAL